MFDRYTAQVRSQFPELPTSYQSNALHHCRVRPASEGLPNSRRQTIQRTRYQTREKGGGFSNRNGTLWGYSRLFQRPSAHERSGYVSNAYSLQNVTLFKDLPRVSC